MKKESLVKAGFWGGIGLFGGIISLVMVIGGAGFVVFFLVSQTDTLLYNAKRLFSSKEDIASLDKWYSNSFQLCEQDLLKFVDASSYKRTSEASTIGDDGYRKLLSWSFEVNSSLMGSDMYSASCVVDKIKKEISSSHRII
jgi:hypothetical protein